jgi:hypothetical protein
MPGPSLVQALAVALALLGPSVASAQQHETVSLRLAGGAYVLAPGAVARAFNTGASVTVTGTVHLATRLALRAEVARDQLPYDRVRFFQQLGIGPVDLATQFGADARLTTWSAGPELALWRTSSVLLSSFTTVGRVHRSTSTGPLLVLYCGPPSVVVDADGTIHAPTEWVAPSGCAQAQAETQISGTAWSVAIGAALRWRTGARSFVSFEAAYARSFLTPASAGFPLRAGYGLTF